MFIKTNGINLYYEVEGQGQSLIFIHGNGEDHSIFYKAASCLVQDYKVYLIDSRRHGKSEWVEKLHYTDMANDIASFIKDLKINKPIICGFSDGGIIALLIASKYPSLIKAIIPCGANTNPHGIKRPFFMEMKKDYEETKNELSRLMIEEPHITREDLHKITCPTLILSGEHDLIKLTESSFIAANIRNSELVIIPNEDHGSYIYKSTKIAEIIESERNYLYS